MSPVPVSTIGDALHSTGGIGSVHKFGANPSIDSANSETVWDVGGAGAYPFNTANKSIEILGGTNDTAAGTGARTVYVEGQNLAGTVLSETATMNGETPVPLTGSYSHIYRAYVVTAGNVGTNDAAITIRIASAGAIQAQILAGNGQTFMAVYRIPAGKTGFMQAWNCRMNKKVGATVEFTLFTRASGEAWRGRDKISLSANGASAYTLEYPQPKTLPALTEIYVLADTDTNATSVGSSFDILLVDDAI